MTMALSPASTRSMTMIAARADRNSGENISIALSIAAAIPAATENGRTFAVAGEGLARAAGPSLTDCSTHAPPAVSRVLTTDAERISGLLPPKPPGLLPFAIPARRPDGGIVDG